MNKCVKYDKKEIIITDRVSYENAKQGYTNKNRALFKAKWIKA
jgi:hypothetical protein